jgi:uncharacterized protein (DUF427 family)
MYFDPVQLRAQSDATAQFPPGSVSDASMLSSSTLTTYCPWKGTASYYSVNVNGSTLKDAAWYYPEPKDAAKNIKDHLAFCESPSALDLGQAIQNIDG